MSDFVHKKVIRIKANETVFKAFGVSNIDELYDIFDNTIMRIRPTLAKLVKTSEGMVERLPYFELGYGTTERYVDLVLFYSYGEECDEWGTSRYLTDEEFKTFGPVFGSIGLHINQYDMRKVDFCYYNGVDPPDYFEVDSEINDWADQYEELMSQKIDEINEKNK